MKLAPGTPLAVGLLTDETAAPRSVGRLAMASGLAQLEWSAEIIAARLPISPLHYPAETGLHQARSRIFEGLHGFLSDCLPDAWGTHGHKQGLMKRSVWLSAKRAPRVEPDVGEVREQKSANEIALSQRSMNVDRIIPQALSLSPRVCISSWTGFDALNSICTPQGTYDVPWIAAGKAMHEDP